MSVTHEVVQPVEVAHGAPVAARRRGWLIRRALLAADLSGLLAAFVLAQVVFGPAASAATAATTSSLDRIGPQEEYLIFLATLPLWILLARSYRLYANDEERADHATGDEVVGIFHLVTVGTFGVLLASWLTGAASPQFSKIALFWLLAIGLVSVSRAGARAICRRQAAYLQHAVIVGCGEVGQRVARKLLNHPEYGVRVVGFLDAEPRERAPLVAHLPVLGTLPELRSVVRDLRIDRVIVAFSGDPHEDTLDLLRSTKDLDVQVDVVPRLFELITPSIQLHAVEGLPMLSMPPMRLSRSDRFLKRGMDLVLAGVGVVLLTPVFALIALAIRIDSRGPAFFRQERIGAGDRAFRIWKFRSMVVDAEDRKHALAHLNTYLSHGEQPVMFKARNDPRITRVGRFLRRTNLDELPQLFNVLSGEMSLVGSRPLIPSEDVAIADWRRRRLDLKPGMTGLWQVLGRNDIPFDEMLVLDYQYVTTWSLQHDVAILGRTVRTVLRPSPEARRP